MPVREFRDRTGVDWQVWNIAPGTAVRLDPPETDRRSPDPLLRHSGQERRSTADRRYGRLLDPKFQGGWLAFESAGEKRRLAPIPSDWDQVTDHELEELLGQATPVQRVARSAEGAPDRWDDAGYLEDL